MHLKTYSFRLRRQDEWKELAEVHAFSVRDAWEQVRNLFSWVLEVERPEHKHSQVRCVTKNNVVYWTRGQMNLSAQSHFDV